MEYRMEELLPVVAKLSKRYTSSESSSVSYDTARLLMEAAVYCLKECERETGDTMLEGHRVDSLTAYEEGYHRDTIIKGMPEFFLKYDARFEPQNHILTLDYPVLYSPDDKVGIDKILHYLNEAEYEHIFLQNFSREAIMSLLEVVRPDYSELYFENICIPVLMRAAACMIADEKVYYLELSEAGEEEAEAYFAEIHMNAAQNRFDGLLDILEKQVMGEAYRGVFKNLARDFAVRIQNGGRF